MFLVFINFISSDLAVAAGHVDVESLLFGVYVDSGNSCVLAPLLLGNLYVENVQHGFSLADFDEHLRLRQQMQKLQKVVHLVTLVHLVACALHRVHNLLLFFHYFIPYFSSMQFQCLKAILHLVQGVNHTSIFGKQKLI